MLKRRLFRDEVVGDEGFRVKLLGRMDIRYTERDRTIVVGAERMLDNSILILPRPWRGWDPPHERERLTAEEWERILRNVVRACGVLGLRVEFENTGPPELITLETLKAMLCSDTEPGR